MKISFCTTCKNRLYHLSQTLPLNLMATSSYKDIEFVIVDYNSEDGMYDWAKKHLVYWEKLGILKYCRTKIPKYFSAAHAKNIAYKNSSGDVICNIDADNFIVEGFCEYILDTFTKNKNCILSSSSQDVSGNHGCCGKITIKKEDFFSVNGYDENQYLGWGWDDVSLRYRAEKHNNLLVVEGDEKFNSVISHDNNVRTSNFPCRDILRTQELSVQMLRELSVRKDYIVNKHKSWGYVEDLKIGI